MTGDDPRAPHLDELWNDGLGPSHRRPLRSPRVPNSLNELLSNRFTAPHQRLLRAPDSLESLLDSYYGAPPRRRQRKHRKKEKPTAVMQSLGCDDGGKVIAQRLRNYGASLSLENAPPASTTAPAPVAPAGPPDPTPTASAPAAPSVAPTQTAPAQVQPTPAQAPAPAQAQPAPVQAQPAPPAPASAAQPAPEAPPASKPPATAKPPAEADDSDVTASEDDFLQDLKDIVLGKKTYDEKASRVVDKGSPAPSKIPAPPANGVGPALQGSDSQEIFNRIAQSMQYAGAYDLGTVELENRFADFDRAADLQQNGYRSDAREDAYDGVNDAKANTADFLQDLDSLREEAAAVASATGAPRPASDAVAEHMSVPGNYSSPFYDTGEHVMAGEDLYRDQLVVGKAPGVAFSYGEIISMADLFKSADTMMDADVDMLRELKTLIDRSLAFYKGKKKDKSLDVTNDKWDKATKGEYMRLAEVNFDHFAPNVLFTDPRYDAPAKLHTNHKEAWEDHHKRAIAEAQRLALDPANRNRSYLPAWPLIINAFGDHYLTDAFSAGHLINKASVSEIFKAKFFSGADLTSAGSKFFDNVASIAWKHKEVADAFSKLRTVESHYLTHPKIDSAGRLGSVLVAVAEKEPERVANLVVKAIHDVFNREGIDVINGNTTKPWKLTGDGYLTDETLAIMRQAVAQSAADITDPTILVSNLDLDKYLTRVWAYVPRFAPGADSKAIARVNSYVDPSSNELASDAAEIVWREVATTVQLLIERKALKPA